MEGSLRNFDQLLDMTVTNILNHTHPYDLACHLYEYGDTNAALQIIRQCIDNGNAKERAWANILWGVMLLDQHQYKGAEDKFNEAAKDKITAYHAHCNLAGSAESQGSNNLAMVLADRAIKYAPTRGDVYAFRGLIRCKLNDYSGGLAEFDREIALDPKSLIADRKSTRLNSSH